MIVGLKITLAYGTCCQLSDFLFLLVFICFDLKKPDDYLKCCSPPTPKSGFKFVFVLQTNHNC